ncbi:MAG: hypothetical protein E7390_06715 [Ruminococcaceae bacterium]|nr:hypothetical protein [Oscillospiraceae bacterium]
MRDYILRVLGISFFTALCHFFLPDGKVRRFAAPVLGLAVTASILLPAVSLFREETAADVFLPAVENVLDTGTYARSVEEEYKKRIAAEIARQGDVTAEITLGDDFSIEGITLSGDVSPAVMLYITTELEVPRSHVEIR